MPGANKIKIQANQHALSVAPYINAAVTEGAVGLAAIAEWLNAHGVLTLRGGAWKVETVRRTQNRIAGLGGTITAVRSRSDAQFARQRARRARERAALMMFAKQSQN